MRDEAPPCFQVGGTLREGALYVPRPADAELPAALLRGEFCYVLAPRQIGKSSLRVRARRTLEAQGVRCASLDLTQIGGRDATSAEWYFDIVHHLARQLGLPDPLAFWRRHEPLSPLHRFSRYLRQEVLDALPGRVVVFIDEIDAVLSLASVSRDDFFAAVRAMYNARADDPAYDRLAICLFGVALPADLIADETRTPFNIGRAIPLLDFTRAEMDALLPGLAGPGAAALLDEVYAHTCGHPYMTQKLCEALVQRADEGPEAAPGKTSPAEQVRERVAQLFLRRGRVLETNLANAERHFAREATGARTAQMLRLYGRLRAGERVPAQGQDPVQMALRLTGMAAEGRGPGGPWLRVRNPIFAAVFDTAWVKEREAERLLAEPLARWLDAGKGEEHLLRGAALQVAYEWLKGRPDVDPQESEFVLTSVMAAQRAERRRARARALFIGVSLLLLMALGAGRGLRENSRERSARAAAEEAARLGAQEAALAARGQAQERRLKQLAEEARDAAAAASRQAYAEQQEAEAARRLAEDRTRRARAELQEAEAARLQAEAARLQAEAARQLAEDREHRAELAMQAARRTQEDAATLKGRAEEARKRLDTGAGLPALPRRAVDVLDQRDAVDAAGFSPDGRRVVTAGEDASAWVWDLSGGTTAVLSGHAAALRFAAFSPDGQRVVTASTDRSAWIWDLRGGRPPVRMSGHPGPVLSAAFSPDGHRVLTASSDMTARVWSANNGRVLAVLRGHRGPVYSAVFSPDGKRALTGGWDGSARIWDSFSGQPLFTLREGEAPAGGEQALWSARFSPDGKRVASAGAGGAVRIWDGQNGRLEFRLRGHRGAVHAVAFSPDGSRLVSAGADGVAVIWDAGSGRALLRLLGHTGEVLDVSFSPDGGRVVTASADRTARVWDAGDGRLLLRLLGHRDVVWSANFSPDGTRVVTASRDHTARIFPGTVQAWFNGGCNLLVQGPAPGCSP